ncbi:hypothetical protein GCM10010233_63510 [Streptomyces pseudogriseolus]|nr:hypothetical protein GCM10010233_63510 [Streptomyces gancidicus]
MEQLVQTAAAGVGRGAAELAGEVGFRGHDLYVGIYVGRVKAAIARRGSPGLRGIPVSGGVKRWGTPVPVVRSTCHVRGHCDAPSFCVQMWGIAHTT